MPRKDSNLTELVSQLNLHSKNDDNEKVLELATNILKRFPDEKPALHSMLVALIKLDRFSEVLKMFMKSPNLQQDFVVEYAYVLYKTEKIDELLKLSNRPEIGIQHALAQLLYKMERFNDAYKVYQQLLEKSGTDVSDEFDIKVNMSAIDVGREKLPTEIESVSYDRLFNAATAKIANSQYSEALDLLREAKLSCESSGLSAEETKDEVAPILAQASYVNQLIGKTDEAVEILKNLKSDGINDKTLVKVVQNNIQSLTAEIYEQNPHILLADITDNGDTSRETHLQKAIFGYNEIVLKSLAGLDVVKRAKKLVKTNNEKLGTLSTAYIGKLDLAPEDVTSKTIKKGLESEIKAGSDNIALQLLLSQAYYNDNKIEAATTIVENLVKNIESSQKYSPGLVGILVNLYKLQGKEAKGYQLIKTAIDDWKKSDIDVSYPVSLLSGIDSLTSTALQYFKDKQNAGDNNLSIIAGLIGTSNSSEEISKLYESHSADLGDIQGLIGDIDAQQLVDNGVSAFVKKRKYAETGDNGSSEKTKKKRKPRLPKDYDPEKPIDPERWMPKRDRSTWRPKKKDKKAAPKVTQGGSVDNVTESVIQESQASPKVAKPKSTPAKKKKKGKK